LEEERTDQRGEAVVSKASCCLEGEDECKVYRDTMVRRALKRALKKFSRGGLWATQCGFVAGDGFVGAMEGRGTRIRRREEHGEQRSVERGEMRFRRRSA